METVFKIKRKTKTIFRTEKLVELSTNRIYEEKKWIFNHIADCLVDNLDYVGYRNECKNTLINYFIGQAGFREKTSKIDVVYFTHFENYNSSYYQTEEHYLWAAKNCDYCVCHAYKYYDFLKRSGVENVQVISPGVDFNLFRPKLVLSWVGRILDSTERRKGLDILSRVRELPWIELRLSNGKVPPSELPEFYNNSDYLLITSRDEAGPMSLLEALACGKRVICPRAIGQVDEVLNKDRGEKGSILTYDIDVYDELLKILEKAYQEKLERSEIVRDYSWRNFWVQHDILFKKLLESNGSSSETI